MSQGWRHRAAVLLVPAGVFQSVIVGGAYGTGREVAEYVSAYGALGGLFAIAAVAAGFALLLGLCFEFARVFRVYDYRSFLRELLGPYWLGYEICFLLLLVVVLAVTGAAAGTVLANTFGIEPVTGTLGMLVAVVACNFFGRRLVEMTLTVGALALSAGLLAYAWLVGSQAGEDILSAVMAGGVEPGWLVSAGQFTLYNSALVPVLLYATSSIRTRGEAIGAALVAALAGVLPAIVLHLSFLARHPAAIEQEIPAYWMISEFGTRQFLWLYVCLLFVTIVQTGVGVLQGLNERIDAWSAEARARPLPKWGHALIAGAAVLMSLGLSRAGIVALIAKGYGTLAWCFLVVFTLPVLTIGVVRIRRAQR
jgi:uncharacterized membrane protein YkvI